MKWEDILLSESGCEGVSWTYGFLKLGYVHLELVCIAFVDFCFVLSCAEFNNQVSCITSFMIHL